VFVLYFQQKGTSTKTDNAKTLQLWALPAGYECDPGSNVNSKFRAKIIATDPRHPNGPRLQTKLNCTFEWNP
jgi:hypothetical protein